MNALLALGGENVLYLHISLRLGQDRSALAFPAVQDKMEMNRVRHSLYRTMTGGAIAPCGCHLQCPSVNAVVPCEGHPSHPISRIIPLIWSPLARKEVNSSPPLTFP